MAKMTRPGGLRAVVAETLAVKHQLLIANRARKRAPKLTSWDRLLLGFWAFFIKPSRLGRVAWSARRRSLDAGS